MDCKLEKNFAPFPQLNTYVDDNELNVDDDILEAMRRQVSILCEEITHYSPDLEEFEINHLFINNLSVLSSIDELLSEGSLTQEQSIDFINDGGAKAVFHEMSCSDFLNGIAQAYPDVAKMALEELIPFATTYECEAAYSTLLAIKVKSRNRLEATNDMIVALAKTKPNPEELAQVRKIHPSR